MKICAQLKNMTPEKFAFWKEYGEAIGFRYVASDPLMIIDVENAKSSVENTSADANTSPSPEIQSTWYTVLRQQASIYGVAVGYCLSASFLSIINKLAVMKFSYPALTALQCLTSSGSMKFSIGNVFLLLRISFG